MNHSHAVLPCLTILLFLALPVAQASLDVETRIGSAIEWIRGQEVASYSFSGFIGGTDPTLNSTMYLEDHALLALALSDYHATHNSARYDDLLKIAVGFLMQARAASGKFYEYYDLKKHEWTNDGGFYSWDAYAVAALAASAYRMAFKSPQDRSYWSAIEGRLKASVVNMLSSQDSEGAWIFLDAKTGRLEALTLENALMLTGLTFIGLFEYQWGSSSQASYYARISEGTARWLFSTQVLNSTLATFGGFPHSNLNSTQSSEENGGVMSGVNAYYTIIGLLERQASPSVYDARTVMINWVDGFVRKMRDSYGGLYFARTTQKVFEYPKTTSAASWMLQSLADVWVNLGGDEYFSDSQKPYDWIVGGNELHADMQTAAGSSQSALGFYSAIVHGEVERTARTSVTALALYGLVSAAFIQVPEFAQGAQVLVVFLVFSVALLVTRKRKVTGGFR